MDGRWILVVTVSASTPVGLVNDLLLFTLLWTSASCSFLFRLSSVAQLERHRFGQRTALVNWKRHQISCDRCVTTGTSTTSLNCTGGFSDRSSEFFCMSHVSAV